MDNKTYAVIMAGGIGSRFWPMSTENKPKQFQDFLGTGKSLIRMSFERFLAICPLENIFIVSNQAYQALIQEELPELAPENIISEPFRRNTAPCIALASLRIASIAPNAKVIVSPADHLILEAGKFESVIQEALAACEQSDSLLTIGIKPSRPDTGYGYIHFDKAEGRLRNVLSFTEKPDLKTAEGFLDAGDYYWNSGMFIWKNQVILNEFKTHLPHLLRTLETASKAIASNDAEGIASVFGNCEDISIDFGIMEKAKNVQVVLGDFTWTDLGTWGSVYEQLEKDVSQNAVLGKGIEIFGASNSNLVVNTESSKILAILGMEEAIIVNTKNALLVCSKTSEQGIRDIVKKLSE